MISFTATICKYDKKGEKSGWTYIEIPAKKAEILKPANKTSFRVKGTLDSHTIQKTAILPVGQGNFILPLNATMRKAIGKKNGDKIKVVLEEDSRILTLSPDLMECLLEDPEAMKFFNSLPMSHRQYYSKWIESAKTAPTKTKRIVMAMNGFARKLGYSEMMRASRNETFE